MATVEQLSRMARVAQEFALDAHYVTSVTRGLTPQVMAGRFEEARRAAAEVGPSVRLAQLEAGLRSGTSHLLRQYLRPYGRHFPHRLGFVHLAILLRVPPNTFHSWVHGSRGIPIEKLIALLNELEVDNPSWLTHHFFREDLRRYFQIREAEGGVALVMRPAGNGRVHDFDFLRSQGFGALLYEARIAAGLNLTELSGRVNRHPARLPIEGQTGGETLGRYERNIETPNRPHNQHFLDCLIDLLGLSPSEAFIAAGRPWVPLLIPTFRPDVWRRDGLDGTPIAPRMTHPYSLPTVTYPAPRQRFTTVTLTGNGFGRFLREARLLSGIKLTSIDEGDDGRLDAASLFGVRSPAVREWELEGRMIPLEILGKMAAHYRDAIMPRRRYAEDPLDELIVRQNRGHFPRLPQRYYRGPGRPLFLTGERDARLARRLGLLPETHFKKRLLVRRLTRGWELARLAAAIEENPRTVALFEDPASRLLPTIGQLRRIAALEGEGEATLIRWRQSVREGFYPDLPWDFLAAEALYPGTARDARVLARRFLPMGPRRERDIGWQLLRSRSGLKETVGIRATARRLELSSFTIARIEEGLHAPVRETLRRIMRGILGGEEKRNRPSTPVDEETATVSLETPALAAVLLAGMDGAGNQAPGQFEAVRRLGATERHFLQGLWDEYNRITAGFERAPGNGHLIIPAEYLRPEDPSSLSREVAGALESDDIKPAAREELAALHHDLRESIAHERTWHPDLGPHWPFDVRYLILERELPLRDGVIGLSLPEVDRRLAEFEEILRQFPTTRRPAVRERLVKLEILCRACRTHDKGMKDPARLVAALFPEVDKKEAADLLLLHALFHYREGARKNGPWVRRLTRGMNLAAFSGAVAEELGVATTTYLTSAERRSTSIYRTSVGLAQLPTVVRGLNLAATERPWEVVYPLYRAELDWAFRVRRGEDRKLPFEMRGDVPLAVLRETGLGALLTAARIERKWTLKELAERMRAANPDQAVDQVTLSHYGTNKLRPSFPVLQAIVATLNEAPNVRPVDPAAAFLATHPTFIDLLPIAVRGQRRRVTLPVTRPIRMVPYAAKGRSVRGGGLGVQPTRSTRGTLDPRGFPSFVQQARLVRGWSLEEAGRRWHIAPESLLNLELDPPEDRGDSLAPVIAGMNLVRHMSDPAGIGEPLAAVLRRHFHSYWRGNTIVEAMRERTFGPTPVFIDGFSLRILRNHLEFDFQTPGEFLYLFRNRAPRAPIAGIRFPATRAEMASFIGASERQYEDWERNSRVPPPSAARRILQALQCSRAEAAAFLTACRRLRHYLTK